jgi:MtrB/PioB family decaheme-associated outer membrane protein
MVTAHVHTRGLAALLLLAAVHVAGAQAPAELDPARWTCSSCPQPAPIGGGLELGAGYVSDPSFRFGDYRGLEDDGAHLILGGDLAFDGGAGRFLDLSLLDLGLGSRSIEVEGGRQGRYELTLRYAEIPHLLYDSTQTPFAGAGTSSLTLPAGWVSAGSTRDMPLAATLADAGIDTIRESYGLGLEWTATRRIDWSVDYRRHEKNGTEMLGAPFVAASSVLPAPVDYRTDEIDAGVRYRGERWFARLGYYGSFFSDADSSIRWDNPYQPFTPSLSEGRTSTPPDNTFQSVSVAGDYRIGSRTRFTGTLSAGRATQDEAFLPATINPDLIVAGPATPGSLDGEVKTFDLDTRVSSSLRSGLRLKAQYNLRRRDNDTPQQLYAQVESDVFVGEARLNLPYGFDHDRFALEGDYRIRRWAALRAGVERRVVERDLQEVERTEEDRAWGRVSITAHPRVDASAEISQQERDGSEYRLLDDHGLPQHPAMRLFNMADRDRSAGQLRIDVRPTDWLSLALEGERGRDDYAASLLGLYDADYDAYMLDLSVALPSRVSLHALGVREEHRTEQRGSERLVVPDWLAIVQDVTDTLGLGIAAARVRNKVDLGLDLAWSRSRGRTALDGAAPAGAFPDLRSRVESARAWLRFPLRAAVDLELGYVHERYRSDNWPIDGVEPDTLSSVLTLGEESHRYDIDLISLSARYRFAQP